MDDRKRKRNVFEGANPSQNQENESHHSQEEAEEDKNLFEEEEDKQNDDEEEEGEDLLENQEKDYENIPELDRYEQQGLDDESYDEIEREAREKAEREIDERKREKQAYNKRIPAALQGIHEEEDDEFDFVRRDMHLQRQRELAEQGLDDEEDEADGDRYLDIEEAKGKLHLWIKEPRTIRWIRRHFKRFLLTFRDPEDKHLVYEQRIQDMCHSNKQSLEITYDHLMKTVPTLAIWVADEPASILPYLNAVAFEIATTYYKNYESIHSEIYVKIRDIPLNDSLRKLRQKHLNILIRFRGVVTRRSAVFSQMKEIYYYCPKCGDKRGPIYQNESQDIKLGTCRGCQSKGPFLIDKENTVYRNYQKITVQECPGDVPPGRVPRHKDVILLGDNIDAARPGDEVEITGIYTNRYDYALNLKHGFPIFATIIEANYIKRVSEIESFELLESEKAAIRHWASKPNIGELIIESIAPSIYGHHHIKTALALAMFGGESKDIGGKHRIRGDINVLMLGDPGVAKSQFLKYVEKTFQRSVYTTGKGASAVGLTASVLRDPSTKEWTLEGGALVLADKGVCLIDEFDKMNEHDRTSIHEAMEQQSISISKAGIVASLQARCSVIAAANPIKGRYNSQLSFADNVDLTDPILSRFDILCVVKDEVDINTDTALATFVINSHIKNHPLNVKISEVEVNREEQDRQEGENHGPSYEAYHEMKERMLKEDAVSRPKEGIPQDILKKYIIYARRYIRPKLSGINNDKITKFYTSLRQESSVSGGIAIGARHIESIIRMAEANARMHLREIVRDDDVDMAISVMLESFIQSQKFSISRMIKKRFASYITYREDVNSLLLHLLGKLEKEQLHFFQYLRGQQATDVKVPLEQLEFEAKNLNIHDITDFLKSPMFNDTYTLTGKVIHRTALIH